MYGYQFGKFVRRYWDIKVQVKMGRNIQVQEKNDVIILEKKKHSHFRATLQK